MRKLAALSIAGALAMVAGQTLVVPSGTVVNVRLIDGIDVNYANVGQRYRAAIDEPVVVNGTIVLPRGTDAEVQAVGVDQSGRFKGSDKITLTLSRVFVNGRPVNMTTSYATMKSKGQGKGTAKRVLGGSGIGAAIGAIAGGGSGAAIGALVGAGGGTALAARKGAHLRLPPETPLQFQVTKAVAIR